MNRRAFELLVVKLLDGLLEVRRSLKLDKAIRQISEGREGLDERLLTPDHHAHGLLPSRQRQLQSGGRNLSGPVGPGKSKSKSIS